MSLQAVHSPKPRKNKFNLSHQHKLTMKMGDIVPCFIQEVIPSDNFRVNTQSLIKFAPLLSPAFSDIDLKIDYFFVPYRLIWDEWEDFITGGSQGDELPSHPRLVIRPKIAAQFTVGSLADYLGIPPFIGGDETNNWQDADGTVELSLLPFRAYQLIYHEYFRDQNFTEFEVTQHTYSGQEGLSDVTLFVRDQITLRKTTWSKDYFTSALPFLQRGPAVQLPLTGDGVLNFENDLRGNTAYRTTGDAFFGSSTEQTMEIDKSDGRVKANYDDFWEIANIDMSNTHKVDLSSVTAVTIADLRKAAALQRFLEIMARGGARYREQIQSMFGARIPDYTIQIPQYLGGGRTPVQVSEVVSTYANSVDQAERPQGDQTGLMQAIGDRMGFKQGFSEHGIILGLARVVPKASYVQGIHKMWKRFDKFDHYFPTFANLGEQEISIGELFTSGEKAADDAVFGYQQRYAEYKYPMSTGAISGQFHTTLSYWEMSRRFEDFPMLNKDFLECTPTQRIFAVTDDSHDKIWAYFNHQVDALRPIPYHSNPSLS